MQKSRCTVLSGRMGDASRYMIPVNVFPLVETILHCSGCMHQSLVDYCQFLMLQVIRLLNLGRKKAPEIARLASTIAITCCLLMAANVSAAPAQTYATADIRSVLQAQQDAWNRSDLDGFMNGYARSPSTIFISEDIVRRGWETVRERYREKYSDRAKMGTLTFSETEITLLSPDAAVVLGRWRLERAKDRPHGRFTLIFKRLPEGWRIVHDHTSAASSPAH
jgi:ketosteroid isomerase-like protein